MGAGSSAALGAVSSGMRLLAETVSHASSDQVGMLGAMAVKLGRIASDLELALAKR